VERHIRVGRNLVDRIAVGRIAVDRNQVNHTVVVRSLADRITAVAHSQAGVSLGLAGNFLGWCCSWVRPFVLLIIK